MDLTLLNLIGEIIVIAFCFFLAYGKSYFKEKGKNVATKEDIEEITKLVEDVKHSFTKETEMLKANLQLLTNIQVGLYSEERNAIIDYNMKYFYWLNLLKDESMIFNAIEKNEQLDIMSKNLNDAYSEFLSCQAKFDLFIDNPELVLYAHQMSSETYKLYMPTVLFSRLTLNKNIQDIKTMLNDTPITEQTEKYLELFSKYEEINTNFLKRSGEHYNIIMPLNHQFQKMCREHIYKILKNNNQ
jgi:hypothetical protein